MKSRRSRFEIIIEIMELCRTPGLPKSKIAQTANVHGNKVKDILVELVTGELISVENRPVSWSGDERLTEYYVRTREGDQLVRDFTGVKERLSTPGAHSG